MYFGRILAAIIGFIIFLIIIISFFGHSGKKATPTGTTTLKPLADYASTDASVSFTTDGIVNADDLHRSIRITISTDQTELDVLQGYNPRVIQSQTFANNQEAYTVFLKALANAGFVTKLKNKAPADERGLCPLGYRYILDLNQDGADLSRLWASSCGQGVGTAAGGVTTIQQLFQNQVPNYETLTDNVNLNAVTTGSQ